jgi:hypothetical protein
MYFFKITDLLAAMLIGLAIGFPVGQVGQGMRAAPVATSIVTMGSSDFPSPMDTIMPGMDNLAYSENLHVEVQLGPPSGDDL